MSKENVESIRAVIEAFNRRDVEALKTLFVTDAEIVPVRAALEGTVYRGPDAVEHWIAAVDESWEELRVELEGGVRDGGDRVLVLGRIHGQGRESGAPIDVVAAAVAYFRDGLITTLHNYTNPAEALEAAGLSE